MSKHKSKSIEELETMIRISRSEDLKSYYRRQLNAIVKGQKKKKENSNAMTFSELLSEEMEKYK